MKSVEEGRRIMPTLAHDRQEQFSYDDYSNWTDEVRWEVIEGVAYDMSPAPSRLHQAVLLKMVRLIADFLDDTPCETYVAPFDVRLPEDPQASDKETFTVVQPDIVVVCDDSKLDERGCKGAPDLVIEILSPATAAKDMKIKRDLYEGYGIGEYWLVHPTDKTVMVYRMGADNEYGKAIICAGEDIVESVALEGLKISMTDLFGFSAEEASPSKL